MASGKKTVIAALVGNSVIGVAKFIAYFFSGSGAMLSEAIHSVADVSNQALLLLGIQRSETEASDLHAYGFGAERYFWALISAVGIFFLGCGVTVYHGIHTIIDHHISEPGVWDYSILAFALVVEGWTLWVAVKGLNVDRGETPFWEFLRTSTDPMPIAVLLEDAVACLGLVVAFVGIWLSQALHSAIPEGVASISIGLLLGVVAIVLIYKNHALIIGRAVDADVEERVIEALQARPSVERILDFKSRILSAKDYRLKMEIEFHGHGLADRILEEEDLKTLAAELSNNEDKLREYLRDFADKVVDELGDEVDRLEAEIRQHVPEAKHIDIETD